LPARFGRCQYCWKCVKRTLKIGYLDEAQFGIAIVSAGGELRSVTGPFWLQQCNELHGPDGCCDGIGW